MILILLCLAAFSGQAQTSPSQGPWRGEIQGPGGPLPINFDVQKGKDAQHWSIQLLNGAEAFSLGESYMQADSLIIPFDLYDSELKGKLNGAGSLKGFWVKKRNGKEIGRLPFMAQAGSKERFLVNTQAQADVNGKWTMDFWGEDGKKSPGVGVFQQNGNAVTGSILRTSGDYRFLQGNVQGDSLYLSYFDGSAVMMIKAKVQGKQLQGKIYAGFSSVRQLDGRWDEQAALPDLKKLTQLKTGWDRIDFRLPDTDGKLISLSDPRFQGKVVVVELMGSWCPNCLDESRYLAPFYQKNRNKGIEVLGLAFEYAADPKVSMPKIENFKRKIGITYPILFAGQPNDETIAKVLPMLQQINGYPTTFIIDKKGKVREIHTGFSGPGTGVYYTDWIHEFEKTISQLLNE